MAINILGIRHHGVGSAAQVLQRLQELQPDLILVEGPPEVNDVLAYISNEQLVPPVAIMLYNENNSTDFSFYPFVEFSPEWVAAKYANENKIPLKAIDLPFAQSIEAKNKVVVEDAESYVPLSIEHAIVSGDPLSHLANIAGYQDSEAWWDYQFEKAENTHLSADHFTSVMDAMSSLRTANIPSSFDKENIAREAYMRHLIRGYQNEMFSNIVIVCGAWHGPALLDIDGTKKDDDKIIKALPKTKLKIAASWIPWTYERMAMRSGYGAGLESPGWYEFKWKQGQDREISWLTNVASTFREEGMDMSTAHVLEAYKLAVSLCQLRHKSSVTLHELNEAIVTVMCMGDEVMMKLIQEKLIVGQRFGSVPEDTPKVPLQSDFDANVKSLRLKISAAAIEQVLDLRKELDVARSVFFHRLLILDIPWARTSVARTKGTFKEVWILFWEPTTIIKIIDKSYLGNSIEQACRQYIFETIKNVPKIAVLSNLFDQVIPAELNESIEDILLRIDELSTISSDIQDLMTAIPNLVNISRYGNVRKSDLSVIEVIIDRLLVKIFFSLPNACYGLNEEISNQMFQLISSLNNAIKLYDKSDFLNEWMKVLKIIADKDNIHDIIKGCVTRLLVDAEEFTEAEAEVKISYALSTARIPTEVAAWVEGFLRGSGMILVYDNRLWNLIYKWVDSLDSNTFSELLPYLRRSFSKFPYGERRQIGAKAKQGLVDTVVDTSQHSNGNIRVDRVEKIYETVSMLMG